MMKQTRRLLPVLVVCFMLAGPGLAAVLDAGQSPQTKEDLIERVQSDDRLESVKATQEFLGRVKAQDGPYLLKLLNSEERKVRQAAVEGLFRVGDGSAVPALVAALEDPDAFVRRRACEALGRIKDARAVPGLIRIIQGEDFTLKTSAFEALNGIAGPADVQSLLTLLKGDDVRLKGQVIDLIAGLKAESALPALMGLLEDEHPYMRAKATEAVAAIAGAGQLGLLEQRLEDEHEYVRFSAMAAIASIGTQDALALVRPHKELIMGAIDGASIAMKTTLVKVLQDLGDPEAVPAVVKAYRFDDGYGGRLTKDLRLASVECLAALGGDAAVQGLLEALTDHSQPVRLKAVAALGDHRTEAVKASLQEFLRTETDREVLQAASRSLQQIAPGEQEAAKPDGPRRGFWAKVKAFFSK